MKKEGREGRQKRQGTVCYDQGRRGSSASPDPDGLLGACIVVSCAEELDPRLFCC